jgi:acyl carrier protein
MNAIESVVRRAVVEMMKTPVLPEDLDLDTDYNTLELDSLDVVAIGVQIEGDLNITLTDEEIDSITTPRELLEVVTQHVK